MSLRQSYTCTLSREVVQGEEARARATQAVRAQKERAVTVDSWSANSAVLSRQRRARGVECALFSDVSGLTYARSCLQMSLNTLLRFGR